MKTRLQRLCNRTLIVNCAEPLWDWVRNDPTKPGPCDKRLAIFRCFGSENTDATTKALVKECYNLVVQTLLAYAQGNPPKDSDKRQKVFPYVRHTTTPPLSLHLSNRSPTPPPGTVVCLHSAGRLSCGYLLLGLLWPCPPCIRSWWLKNVSGTKK